MPWLLLDDYGCFLGLFCSFKMISVWLIPHHRGLIIRPRSVICVYLCASVVAVYLRDGSRTYSLLQAYNQFIGF